MYHSNLRKKKSCKIAYSCASEKTQVWLKLVEKLSESLRQETNIKQLPQQFQNTEIVVNTSQIQSQKKKIDFSNSCPLLLSFAFIFQSVFKNIHYLLSLLLKLLFNTSNRQLIFFLTAVFNFDFVVLFQDTQQLFT